MRLAVAMIACMLASPAPAAEIVLVHGAWTGPWHWHPVATALRRAGHLVLMADLPADDPATGVDALAADLATRIEAAGMKMPVIVAHAAGVRPVTRLWAAGAVPMAAVILVEAPLPRDGPGPAFAHALDPTGLVEPPARLADRYGAARLRPVSRRALKERVELDAPLPRLPGALVLGRESPMVGLRDDADRAAAELGWEVVVVEGGHDLPRDARDALVEVIGRLAADG